MLKLIDKKTNEFYRGEIVENLKNLDLLNQKCEIIVNDFNNISK